MANFHKLHALLYFYFVLDIHVIHAVRGDPTDSNNDIGIAPEDRSFNASLDAEAINTAIEDGNVTRNSTGIIAEIVTRRNTTQHEAIEEIYRAKYGKDLLADLDEKLSGDFRNHVVRLMTRPEVFAKKFHEALQSFTIDKNTIVSLVCTLSSRKMREVARVYQQLYGKRLEDDLVADRDTFKKRVGSLFQRNSDTSKMYMVSLIQGNRSRNIKARDIEAEFDVMHIYSVVTIKPNNGKDWFHEIFTARSYNHLLRIFDVYFITFERTIEKLIIDEFDEDTKVLLLELVAFINSMRDPSVQLLYSEM